MIPKVSFVLVGLDPGQDYFQARFEWFHPCHSNWASDRAPFRRGRGGEWIRAVSRGGKTEPDLFPFRARSNRTANPSHAWLHSQPFQSARIGLHSGLNRPNRTSPKGNQSKQGTCCLMKSENIGSNKVTMNVIRKKKRVTMRFMVLLKVIVI